MSTLIEEIRRKIASDRFEFSKHAVDQSILRGIRVQDIKEAIAPMCRYFEGNDFRSY